jgi:hypothetical protein
VNRIFSVLPSSAALITLICKSSKHPYRTVGNLSGWALTLHFCHVSSNH